MSDHVRVGIIGTGGWGTTIADQFYRNPDATVVALADVDETSRTRAGESLGVSEASRASRARSQLFGFYGRCS